MYEELRIKESGQETGLSGLELLGSVCVLTLTLRPMCLLLPLNPLSNEGARLQISIHRSMSESDGGVVATLEVLKISL